MTRTNFGYTISGCSNSSSIDAVYSLVPWSETVGSQTVWNVTAVGSTNESGSDTFALAKYRLSTGAIVTSYGTLGNGLVVGPAGDAYSAVLDNTSPLAANDIAVGGTSSNDFTVALYKSNGTLDTSNFGTSGVFTTDFGTATTNTTDACFSIALNSDGSILAGGTSAGGLALADYLLNETPTLS